MALGKLIEYQWMDGAEPLWRYGPGNYRPVMVDEILHNRYQVVDKLGFGG